MPDEFEMVKMAKMTTTRSQSLCSYSSMHGCFLEHNHDSLNEFQLLHNSPESIETNSIP